MTFTNVGKDIVQMNCKNVVVKKRFGGKSPTKHRGIAIIIV